MILVTGANGHLGSQTIEHMLKKNPLAKVTGLVRSEEKGAELRKKGVETRIGDYNNYSSIKKAMQGIDTLLLISSSSLKGRVNQHKNVIDAAKESGVVHIFYISIVQANKLLGPLSPSHNETELLLKDSGIPYTVYRNTFYAEFLPIFLGDALATGDWYFPSDGKKINLTLRSEMAEALANGLAHSVEHKNKIYEITSLKPYALDEIARLISDHTHKKITYHDISISDFEQQLEQAGLPNEAVKMSTAVATTFANGGLDYAADDLEQLLGRKPADLETIVPQLIPS